ncbi:TolC family protein [Paludisphaera borealis]|uniref:Cobalt-zinc-cadmium resistance protein CzcC n=1 Tax=Paludisphaera borealis TaxID=1387353 RepID=A0A1U7CQA5_9BACT|nr:TolC family protein [Paludisphaera borealis]APW61088.1 Cobalt-zinc-cadmium resistance protein CzcC [Paludisphaera borealis]
MSGRSVWLAIVVACAAGCRAEVARAQVSLSDDIIAAAQAKNETEKRHHSSLGRSLGTAESPYRRKPGSTDINLGGAPPRRAVLPRLARLRTSTSAFSPPPQEPGRYEQGVAPSIERLPLPLRRGPSHNSEEDLAAYDEEGPPDGLTLDASIRRLIDVNRDLRVKALELPQAEADILTAGLRENPLVFYGTDDIAYGSYSPARSGEVEHGISLVLPIDYTGKRRRRVELAKKEQCVLRAQYQDAVRVAIDGLYTAYVDALVARQAIRAAEDSLRLIDELLKAHAAVASPTEKEREELDDLTVERDVTEMAVEDTYERYGKARQQLADLLELAPEEAESLELRGKILVPSPKPPPLDELIAMAKERRPDVVAHRIGVDRARAEWSQEKSERLSDAYFLYSPMNYLDRSQSQERSVNTWGAGVFVSVPLFNRNQGNVRRAEINVIQSQIEADVAEDRAVGEVRHAYKDLEHSLGDLERFEKATLPAIRRKRDRAQRRLNSGEIHPEDFLKVERETTSLVRFYRDTLTRQRRNMLKLNTAVGLRILP